MGGSDKLALGLLSTFSKPFNERLTKNKLAVLIYHRVRVDDDPLTPYDITVEQFESEIALLSRYFNVLSLETALDYLQSNALPERSVCITFDDGYMDQLTIAVPVLRKYGLTATFFVPTGYLESGCMWNDMVIESIRCFSGRELNLDNCGLGCYKVETVSQKRNAIARLITQIKRLHPDQRQEAINDLSNLAEYSVPGDLMMGEEHVKRLVSLGMEVGSHTNMHPLLTSLNDKEAYSEIVESKKKLESIVSREIKYFAYPNGKPYEDYMPEHVEICKKAGFQAAFSTAKGVVTNASDLYQLPRFTPWDSKSSKFMLRLLGNYIEIEPLIV